jgi:hypothetical protein
MTKKQESGKEKTGVWENDVYDLIDSKSYMKDVQSSLQEQHMDITFTKKNEEKVKKSEEKRQVLV